MNQTSDSQAKHDSSDVFFFLFARIQKGSLSLLCNVIGMFSLFHVDFMCSAFIFSIIVELSVGKTWEQQTRNNLLVLWQFWQLLLCLHFQQFSDVARIQQLNRKMPKPNFAWLVQPPRNVLISADLLPNVQCFLIWVSIVLHYIQIST